MFLFYSSSVSTLAGELALDVLATVLWVTACDIVIVCFEQRDGGYNASYVSF